MKNNMINGLLFCAIFTCKQEGVKTGQRHFWQGYYRRVVSGMKVRSLLVLSN